MFTPGDYVVYSIEGVCRVEEAGRLNVPGLERGRDYYRYKHSVYRDSEGGDEHCGQDISGDRTQKSTETPAEIGSQGESVEIFSAERLAF